MELMGNSWVKLIKKGKFTVSTFNPSFVCGRFIVSAKRIDD